MKFLNIAFFIIALIRCESAYSQELGKVTLCYEMTGKKVIGSYWFKDTIIIKPDSTFENKILSYKTRFNKKKHDSANISRSEGKWKVLNDTLFLSNSKGYYNPEGEKFLIKRRKILRLPPNYNSKVHIRLYFFQLVGCK